MFTLPNLLFFKQRQKKAPEPTLRGFLLCFDEFSATSIESVF